VLMGSDVDIVRSVAASPLRTVRLKDVPPFVQNMWRAVESLTDRGALLRLGHGIYTAPPDGEDGRLWRPSLESTALAIASARAGERSAALMGVSAARHWGVLPRAIGVATVAVDRGKRAVVELDQGGAVQLVPRPLDLLDLVLERMSLGQGLVATKAQTLFDLVSRRPVDGLAKEIGQAIENLMVVVEVEDYADVLARAVRPSTAARAALERLRHVHG